jgi:hypothetical protein
MAELARQRGWPAPVIYAEDSSAEDNRPGEASGSPGLARLAAAISAGRHDALLIPGLAMITRAPVQLMTILSRCSAHGVAVQFCSTPAAGPGNPPPAVSSAEILAQAAIEALSALFADWRIWADEHGWHARRRGHVYLQDYHPGAPAFCVHAGNSVDLAAQLRWQQAADTHVPAGCSRRRLAGQR